MSQIVWCVCVCKSQGSGFLCDVCVSQECIVLHFLEAVTGKLNLHVECGAGVQHAIHFSRGFWFLVWYLAMSYDV